jgi:LAO/AO transport system kinase
VIALEDWIQLLRTKDKRTIAQTISRIEKSDRADAHQILEKLLPYTGDSCVIGITGPPGAGKSSLIGSLISFLRDQDLTVGVLAVDPTSPFTGGAILGDRIRMNRHATDKGVFLRSMANRGKVGGLSKDTRNALRVLDAADFDVILIETVGVGQSELAITHLADTVCVVLHPGAGDMIQVTKSGVMEIADLYVVNKADQTGAARLIAEIEDYLEGAMIKKDWLPTVLATSAQLHQGIGGLWEAIQKHQQYLRESGRRQKQRSLHLEQEIQEELQLLFEQRSQLLFQQADGKEILNKLQKGELSIREVTAQLADILFRSK